MIATVDLGTGLFILGGFAVLGLIVGALIRYEIRRPLTAQEIRVERKQAADAAEALCRHERIANPLRVVGGSRRGPESPVHHDGKKRIGLR